MNVDVLISNLWRYLADIKLNKRQFSEGNHPTTPTIKKISLLYFFLFISMARQYLLNKIEYTTLIIVVNTFYIIFLVKYCNKNYIIGNIQIKYASYLCLFSLKLFTCFFYSFRGYCTNKLFSSFKRFSFSFYLQLGLCAIACCMFFFL